MSRINLYLDLLDLGEKNGFRLRECSFPVEQTAIDAGKLLTWTKGFSAKNAIGQDIVRLLQDAFDQKHIHVRCNALVNDVSLTLCSIIEVDLPGVDCWNITIAVISEWTCVDRSYIRDRDEWRVYR